MKRREKAETRYGEEEEKRKGKARGKNIGKGFKENVFHHTWKEMPRKMGKGKKK